MRRLLLLFIIAGLILSLIYFDVIVYGLRQGAGQWNIIASAKKVEKVLEDPAVPDSIKEKLILIGEVREFAINSLGLEPSKNYTTFYDQKGEDVLWNVTGSMPYALVPYEWEFPLLGSFPYKGHFKKKWAREEERKLLNQGYDTRIYAVTGWSTLGWFRDPILSNMLNRSEGRLAELIIHELTHGTLYVKDSVEFNENLATFVGRQGAMLYLSSEYGPNSTEYQAYLKEEHDYDRYVAHMLSGVEELQELYDSFDDQTPVEVKKERKNDLIQRIVDQLDTVSFSDSLRYNNRFTTLPNNAWFLSIIRYQGEQTDFESVLNSRFHGNLADFIAEMKEDHTSMF